MQVQPTLPFGLFYVSGQRDTFCIALCHCCCYRSTAVLLDPLCYAPFSPYNHGNCAVLVALTSPQSVRKGSTICE